MMVPVQVIIKIMTATPFSSWNPMVPQNSPTTHSISKYPSFLRGPLDGSADIQDQWVSPAVFFVSLNPYYQNEKGVPHE
jgi:hypothetical protein